MSPYTPEHNNIKRPLTIKLDIAFDRASTSTSMPLPVGRESNTIDDSQPTRRSLKQDSLSRPISEKGHSTSAIGTTAAPSDKPTSLSKRSCDHPPTPFTQTDSILDVMAEAEALCLPTGHSPQKKSPSAGKPKTTKPSAHSYMSSEEGSCPPSVKRQASSHKKSPSAAKPKTSTPFAHSYVPYEEGNHPSATKRQTSPRAQSTTGIYETSMRSTHSHISDTEDDSLDPPYHSRLPASRHFSTDEARSNDPFTTDLRTHTDLVSSSAGVELLAARDSTEVARSATKPTKPKRPKDTVSTKQRSAKGVSTATPAASTPRAGTQKHQDAAQQSTQQSPQRAQRPRRSGRPKPDVGNKYIVDHASFLTDDDEDFTIEGKSTDDSEPSESNYSDK